MRFLPFRSWMLFGVSALGLILTSCATERAWRDAQQEDTGAAYARFLHDHPESDHRSAAQEGLDYHKLRGQPSRAGYEAFQSDYPESRRLQALADALEPTYFDHARSRGTPEAYEAFLARFPSGAMAARAQGNQVYLEASGFGSRLDALALFAEQHPASDFAAEARRSAELARSGLGARFHEIELEVELMPGVAESDRLQARFIRLARIAYAQAGLNLQMPEDFHPDASDASRPDLVLRIHHQEFGTQIRIEDGQVERPGMMALTTISLRVRGSAHPLFEREFRLRVDQSQHVEGSSVLSSSAAGRYWDKIFVPIVRSHTFSRVRAPHALDAGLAVDVDAGFDRAVVLFRDGRVQLIELSDPDQPIRLADYPRKRDLKQWSGVKIVSGMIVIYGEEGLEFVSAGEGVVDSSRLGRDHIGSVRALSEMGNQLILAGPSGLRLLDPRTGHLEELLKRPISGLAVREDSLVFTDGESLFVSTLPLLRQHRIRSQIRVGRDFGLTEIRTLEEGALAIGAGGLVFLRIPDHGEPEVEARLLTGEVGAVHDAVERDGRLFLIGDRGLQVVDSKTFRVMDSADLEGLSQIAIMGRHLVAAGPDHIQAVDLSEWSPRFMDSPASAQ